MIYTHFTSRCESSSVIASRKAKQSRFLVELCIKPGLLRCARNDEVRILKYDGYIFREDIYE